jgi:hypothetical protein
LEILTIKFRRAIASSFGYGKPVRGFTPSGYTKGPLGVAVGEGVAVGVNVAVGVDVLVAVSVAVSVAVGVKDGVLVGPEGVLVANDTCVGRGVLVANICPSGDPLTKPGINAIDKTNPKMETSIAINRRINSSRVPCFLNTVEQYTSAKVHCTGGIRLRRSNVDYGKAVRFHNRIASLLQSTHLPETPLWLAAPCHARDE